MAVLNRLQYIQVSGQCHPSAALIPEKDLWYPLNGEGFGPRTGWIGTRLSRIRGLIPGKNKIFFSSNPPYRLWDPFSLLFNGYRFLFPGGRVACV